MLKPLDPAERETLSVLLAKIVLHTFAWPDGDALLEPILPAAKAPSRVALVQP
jgi:hypothetical protein